MYSDLSTPEIEQRLDRAQAVVDTLQKMHTDMKLMRRGIHEGRCKYRFTEIIRQLIALVGMKERMRDSLQAELKRRNLRSRTGRR
jgi:hypothetical protein